MKKKKLVSVAEYAVLCGMSKEAVYNRIKAEEITSEKITYEGYITTVIDVIECPPKPAKKRGRKKFVSSD